MYRPGYAVQARELTTQQSLLQNQIEQMGDHLFKHGAMVIPGETHIDLNYEAIKLTSNTGTLANFDSYSLTGGTSGVKATVIGYVATDGTDPDTLFVKYKDSGTDNATPFFTDGETITSGHTDAMTAVVDTTVTGSSISIDAGTYYINGYFVNVDKQTLVLDKYTNEPSYRVGLTIVETFETSTDDTSLLDNATGSSNVNATGAHRFKIDLTLAKLALTSTADASFVELIRLNNGVIEHKVSNTAYNIMEQTLARRTYDESGDYSVDDFDIDIRESLLDGTNRGVYASGAQTVHGNAAAESMLAVGLGEGVAYVKGYEVRKIGTTFVDLTKAREYQTANGSVTRFETLPYINITQLYNTPDVGFVSGETAAYKTLKLTDTEHTRGTVNADSRGTVYQIGRALSRGIEYNTGTASTVFLSTASVTTNNFKHYLFDTEMFAHINCVGATSGALTTGETVTGGSSGATGIVESISTDGGSIAVSAATAANPVVVTATAHGFKEGQQVTISGVGGMTDINATWTCKDPAANTFKLYQAATSAIGDSGTQPATVDGSGYSSHSSNGVAKHDVVVLSNVKGTFSDGETITGGTSSVTATVQYSALRCKGFEQKDFTQVKGVSMAGSPVFTADVDLTSTYGDQKTLTGAVTGANSASVIYGFGTRFTSELRIGDEIEWTDDANTTVTKIVKSIASNTQLEITAALGGADVSTKVSFIRKRTKLQSPTIDRALFKLPYEVVKTLKTTDNSEVSDTSHKVRRQFVTTLSSSGTATLTAGTNEVFTAHSDTDFTVSVMSTGAGGTGAVGDVVTLGSAGDFTLGGSPTGKTVAIDLGSGWNGHKIKILATISASVAGSKTKTANTAETAQISTQALCEATNIKIGYADVYAVDSVYMAADFSTDATTSDTDVTSRFTLDTGQRDNFYDVSRLVRKAGKQAPTGRLLITYSYYSHGAGNFFDVDSYSGVGYGTISSYTSDVTGEKFELRDCLDFRPRVDDASTIGSGGVDRSYDGTGNSTIEIMKFGTDVTADLEYYLAKKAKVFMTSNGMFNIVAGESAIEPQQPEDVKDAMHLYDLYLPPYTFNTTDIQIRKIDNKRYTMRDIGRLEDRLENVEYYTQLSLLESEAQNMQIQDSDGLDRFKNGIIVDNFTGHGIGDVSDNDYAVSMDMAQGELRPAFHQDNAALVEATSALSTTVTDAVRTTNGYQKTGDLITLPYTSISYIDQTFASTTVNLNPYDTIPFVGNITLDPEIDEWMETEQQPEMVVDLPGSFDTISALASEGVLNLNLGTVWGNWNDQWAGAVQEGNRRTNTSRQGNRRITTTTINTEQRVGQRRSGIRTTLVPNTIRRSLGDRVTSVAFVPFIRQKTISFTGESLKPNTRVYPFFDGIDVSTYVTPTGSTAGAALTTDANGKATGDFAIPDPTDLSKPRWRTGKRTFRLTSNSSNSLTGDIFTSAESDYTAKGLLNAVQGTIVSTREAQSARETVAENTVITRRSTRTETQTEVIEQNQQGGGGGGQGGRDNGPPPWTPPGRQTRPTTGTPNFAAAGSGQGNNNRRSGPPRGFRGRDPVAQSFYVDTIGGIFITSVDLYFSAKSSTLPVTVELRTMENGYPTRQVIPFGRVNKAAADISTSTDATTATTFTFPSPVYLQPMQEYCFVALANTDEFTVYSARMGQKTLDGARLISKQPYLGSMFKSQNGGTWDAEQNEDVKFKLNFAQFTQNTFGYVYLVNDELPVKSLTKSNPITTTSGSATITVNHRNHGMHSTSNNVTIAGVASGDHNGIAHSNINGTYTTIGNIKHDSYTITAQNSDTASASGDIGSTTTTATRNILYDVIHPVIGAVIHPETTLTATMRTTGGRTLEASETEFSLNSTSKANNVVLNQDYFMTAPGMIASSINETNEMSSSKSFTTTLTMFTPTGVANLSPVIDTKRMSITLIQNRLNNPVSGTTPDFVAETVNTGGSSAAQYVTKPVVLTNNSTALDIRISANVRSTSAVKMYYRLSSSEDVRLLGNIPWTAFNSDGTPDSSLSPAEDEVTFKEHKWSATSLAAFSAFQLKVTMTGTNSSYPPILKDMRGIALAV
jgi:hypothetical protein